MENYITHQDIVREDTASWFTDSWFLWQKKVPVKVMSISAINREVVVSPLVGSTFIASVEDLQTFPIINQYIKHNGRYLYVTQNGVTSHKKGLTSNKLRYCGVHVEGDYADSERLVKFVTTGGDSRFQRVLHDVIYFKPPVFKSLEHYLHCFNQLRRWNSDSEQNGAQITNDLFIVSGILPLTNRHYHVILLKGTVIGHLNPDNGEVQLSRCSHEIKSKLKGYFQDVKFTTESK